MTPAGGFFDNFTDDGQQNWVKKEEKAELAASQTPLIVTRVRKSLGGKYGDRYIVGFELDGEDRALSFGAEAVESRDRMLDALIDWLAEGGEAPALVLEKVGQSYLLRNAEETVSA